MKKNAFTLLELLAVIVILAIIALITTPIILGVIEEAKKQALGSSAYGLIDSARNKLLFNDSFEEKTYTIENSSFVGEGLDIRGALPKSGSIKIDEIHRVAIAITDGKWCAKKDFDDNEIIITEDLGDCTLEPTLPPN